MPLMRFNWVDILFVTILIRTSYIGFKNGLLLELFKLVSIVSAYILSFASYAIVSHFISKHTGFTGAMSDIIAFSLIFLLILLIFKLLVSGLKILSGDSNISLGNRIVGTAAAFGRGVLLASLLYGLFVSSPFEYLIISARDRSLAGPYVEEVAPLVYNIGSRIFPWELIETPLIRALR